MEIRNPSLLGEAQGPEPESIEMTRRALNLSESLRVAEADVRLSVDTDSYKWRPVAVGKRIFFGMIAFLLREDSEGKVVNIVSVCFTISSATQANYRS